MRVFLAGATGQIGSRLLPVLQKRGDQLVLLTRNAAKARAKTPPAPPSKGGEKTSGSPPLEGGVGGVEYVEGDPTKPGPWMDAISGCQGVINLVGENLFAKRWTEDFKRVLRESRLQSTSNIVAAIQKAKDRPGVLVQGSAVGYYGYHGDEDLTEESPPGDDFLARLCVEWESTAKPVEQGGVRLVLVRTGIVLDSQGGALPAMLTPFKMVLFGGPVGSGKQWYSWVHYADEVGILLLALDNAQARGPLNATAPQPATNRQLATAIGAALHRPSFFPTPGFLLFLKMGEVAELVLKGARALPKKALELGYKFQFPEIEGAMQDLLGKQTTPR